MVRFGDTQGFPYEEMVSEIGTSWVDMGQVSRRFLRGTIATGDQDLDEATRMRLQEESRLGGWNILGADWESGAIATVAEWNKVRCLILRGVSDIPEPHSAGPHVQSLDYEKNTPLIMERLLEMMSQIRFHFPKAP
jgi:adenosylhomocysteine nucleosidase